MTTDPAGHPWDEVPENVPRPGTIKNVDLGIVGAAEPIPVGDADDHTSLT